MLFQHPWDAKAEGDDEEVLALSPDKNQIMNDTIRFENLSSKLQRSFHEKNMMLGEIQSLKSQLRNANSTNNAIDAERESWNRLIDANVRSGIMACVWCMKAQVVKMTAMAFHKWKAFKILDIRMNAKQNEKITFDASSTDAMVEAAAAAAQYFRHLMAQISPEGNALTGELSDHDYPSELRRAGSQEDQYNGKNGRKSPSPQRGHSEDLKWSKNNGNGNGIGPYPGAAYSPVDSPESRVGVTSDNNRGPGGGSPQRDRELDSWARNDRSRAQDSRDREGGRGRNGDRTRDSSRERRSDSRSEGTGPRRSESARRTPSRPDPSPQYMISTASFASKLKKLRVDSSEVKRKPGMRAGSVSAVLKYSTNQRSQSFSSSYNPNKFKSTGSKSDSAQRDYEEYGDDVMEYSGPLSGGNIENFRISRDNDFSSLRNGTSTRAHTQHTQHAHQTQNIMRSRSTEASRDRKDDRSRVKVAEPAGVKALSSSSTARYGYSGGSASVRQARETSANEPSLGYMNNFLKEHSSRTLHLDTEDRHRMSHHDNGKEAFFSPTLLRRPETTAGVRGGARARAGAGRSPSPSPSPTWCEDSEYRDDGSPGGVYTMPQFKRYHEQLGRARGRS